MFGQSSFQYEPAGVCVGEHQLPSGVLMQASCSLELDDAPMALLSDNEHGDLIVELQHQTLPSFLCHGFSPASPGVYC